MNQDSLFKKYNGTFEAENAREFSDSKEKKDKIFGYSPFALQDAVGERSVKKIWIEYEKLRFAGIEAEELIHKIISKVRDMTAIKMGTGREELGLSDYPYSKSKRDLKNWKEADLKNFYAKLVETYHRARMESDHELDVALEKILLSI
jgi:hypothetical protein